MTDSIITMLNSPLKTLGSVLVALLVLLFMITIHEFGHYIVAKLFDFKINEFSIGMGPAIYKKKRKNGEYFSIRLLPLGGYCAFEGEDDDAEDPRAFNNKKPWQRILVLLAGATMNFLGAILIFCLSFGCYGQMCYQVFETVKTTDAESELSFKDNDIILSVNGKTVYSPADMISALKDKKSGDTLPASVMRGGKKQEISIKLTKDPVSKNISDINGILECLNVAKITIVAQQAEENREKTKLMAGDAILRISVTCPEKGDPIDKDNDERFQCSEFTEDGTLEDFSVSKDAYMKEKRAYTMDDFLSYVKTAKEENPDGSAPLYVYISRMVNETDAQRILLRYDLKDIDIKGLDDTAAAMTKLNEFLGITETATSFRLTTENVRLGFFRSIGHGTVYAFKNAGTTLVALGQLLTGRLGLNALGGPVTTIKMTSQMVSLGFHYLLEISGFIGVSLAVFNLLPIPALDGARTVFVIIEWIRKKPINRKVEGMIHSIGLIALLAFAIMIDLIKCL